MNKKKLKFIVPSIIAIVASTGVLAGSTYALFTSQDETNITVSSGKVNLTSSISNLKLYSALAKNYYDENNDEVEKNGSTIVSSTGEDQQDYYNKVVTGKFSNGGTATVNDGTLTLLNVTPGDKVTGQIDFTNNSNVDIKYRVVVELVNPNDADSVLLYQGLDFYVNGKLMRKIKKSFSSWTTVSAGGSISSIPFSLQLPINKGNSYQEKTTSVRFTVEALQNNAYTVNSNDEYFLPTLVSAPTAKTDLTYSGVAQQLVNDGVINGGTLEYKIGNGEYSSTLPSLVDAGTYSISYRIAGDEYHGDLDGSSFNVTIAKGDATYILPTANDLTYIPCVQSLLTPGSSDHGHFEYKLEGGTYSTTVPDGYDAGNYTVYYKFVGDANHNDVTESSINVTIKKASTSCLAPTDLGSTYTGQPVNLISSTSSEGGTVQYKLEGGTYSASIPTATEAGTYKVYYYVKGDSNHNDTDDSYVTATIKKADIDGFTNPTAKQNLVYNGSSQELVEKTCDINTGTVLYNLDGSSWSTEIPTATIPGTYTVGFKVTGDKNHNDTSENSVQVTIDKAKAVITAEPWALIPLGSGSDLVNPGTCTEGTTLKYATTDTATTVAPQDEAFSTDIPQSDGVTSVYRVWYKAFGNELYSDSDAGFVDVSVLFD